MCECETHSFADVGQVLLDKGQSDANKSLLEDPLPHCAAVIVILLQADDKLKVSAFVLKFYFQVVWFLFSRVWLLIIICLYIL